MTKQGEKPTEDSKNSYETSRKSSQYDKLTVIGLIVGIAAALAAVLVVGTPRDVFAVLLMVAGLTLIVLWKLTDASKSRRFNLTTTVILTVALILAGCYLYFVPVKHAAAKPIVGPNTPKAPALYFPQGGSARVPYCNSYAVQVQGSVPRHFQVVMFDAPTDSNGNVVGDYNFDGQAHSGGRIPGLLGVRNLTVGLQSAKAGFTAVVVAAVIADSEAQILEAVQAAPTGWGLKNLPVLLTSKSLQVTRNGKDAPC